MQLLLNVWREACRHTDIGDAVAESAPALFQRLPLDYVLIRRVDMNRRLVETIAAGVCRPGVTVPEHTRDELEPADFDRLLSWCRQGDVEHGFDSSQIDLPPGTLPAGLKGEILAGPLASSDGAVGLVLFVTHLPRRFQDRHQQQLKELLEPFTVWVENDRRQRELRTLREAAEADNRSLLSRLGRHDISDTIIGVEAGLKSVMERAEQVARTDVPVLILGETGSGKEVVARSIHQRSPRKNGPFCG
jgi:hydrogenase-4 transcriptional activator